MEEDQQPIVQPEAPTDTPTAEPTPPTANQLEPDVILRYIEQVEDSLSALRRALAGQAGMPAGPTVRQKAAQLSTSADPEGARVIEGVFDGQNMVGPDGKQYSVPANYASKSKLVEGDVLKLTITRDGSFIYKQIGPVERQRLIGELVRDSETGEYKVLAGGKPYKVLLASVTYFKGENGDEVVVLVPKDGDTRWAAVENIIKKSEQAQESPEG